MKKRFAAILFAALFVLGAFALTACGQEAASLPPPPPRVTPPPPAAPPAAPPVTAPTAPAAPAVPTAERMVFRISESHSFGYPTEYGLRHFASRLYELTDGEIYLEVHYGGILGSETEAIEMVRGGELEFVRVAGNMLAAEIPEIDALGMPFLYRDREHMFAVLDGELGQDFLERFRAVGMIGLTWFDAGARSFYFSEATPRTPAEMEGLIVRVPPAPIMTGMVYAIGATPTVVAFGEVNAAFAGGTIDGAENSVLSYEAQGRPIHAPNLVLTEHIRTPEVILINAELFDGLSAEHQAAIREAATEAGLVQRAEWIRQEDMAELTAMREGANIIRLTDAERQLFVDAMMPFYDEYAFLAGYIQTIRENY